MGFILLSIPVTIGITVWCVVLALRGRNVWLLAWLYYLAFLMPTITGLRAGIQPWADRYSYLPTMGLFLLIGGGVVVLWERSERLRSGTALRAAVLSGSMVLVVTYVHLNLKQIPIWKDSETLWQHAVDVAPGIPMSYANLGVALYAKGDLDSAVALYYKALEIEPDYADALYNLGIAYEAKGQSENAIASYEKAIESEPKYADAYINLGNMHVNSGRLDDGIALYRKAVALDPSDADAYYNMGTALYRKGNRQAALEFFRKTISLAPGNAKAHFNMGIIFSNAGDQDAAIESFTTAARLGFSDAQKVLNEWGYVW
jgi:tetratricopeptide (TPR) repeat protein